VPLILVSEKDLKFTALGPAKGSDIRPLISGAFEKANAKGGGGPSFFQGQFACGEDLSVFLAELGTTT